MERPHEAVSSALAARPDSGDAPDAIALAIIIVFVGVVLFGSATIGQAVALWRMGALMALPGDPIWIIDENHPLWRKEGATGRLISEAFRGQYIAEIDGDPPVRTELTDGQFIVLPRSVEEG